MTTIKHFKNWGGLLCVLLTGVLLCLSACGKQPSPPKESPDMDDPFADDEEDYPGGSITHGSDSPKYSYHGEKLEIPYSVTGTGMGTVCGFLLFLDGIPQPYQIESDGPSSYLHLLKLEDNIQKDFSFYFEPVTGKTGETLSLYILSVTPQIPNQTDGLPLGTSQNFLEYFLSLTFEEDVASTQPKPDSSDPILTDLSVSAEELTPESMDRYLQTNTTAATVNDLDTWVFEWGQSGEEGAKLEHVLLGHPQVRYRTTLFLDYTPLWYDGRCFFDRDLESGIASRLDAGLDANTLNGAHILSAISIPRNASDFPDDVLTAEIWDTLLEDTQ